MEILAGMAARDKNDDQARVLHVALGEGPADQEKDNPTSNPGAAAPLHEQTQERNPMENPAGMATRDNNDDDDAAGVLHVAPEEGPAEQENDDPMANPGETAPWHNLGISAGWTPEEQAVVEEVLARLFLGLEHQDRNQIHRQDRAGGGTAPEGEWVPVEGGQEKGQEEEEGETTELPDWDFISPEIDYADAFMFKEIGGVVGDLLELNDILLKRISENIANLQMADNPKLFKLVWENFVRLKDEIAKMPFSMPTQPLPPPPPMSEL